MATTYLNGVLFTGLGAPDSPVITTTADVADTIISTGILTGSVFSTSYNDDDIFYAGNATNALFDGGAQNDDLILTGLGGNIPITLTNITVDGSGGSDYLDFGGAAALIGPDTKVNIVNSLIRGGGGDSLGGTDSGDDLYFGEDTTITRTKINGNVGSDYIRILGPSLATSTVAGGQDNDFIYIDSDVVGSLINGNQGTDSIDIYGPVTAASSVFGGQGGDYITVHDTFTASTLSGDKGDDTIGLGNAISASSVLGGDGNDGISFRANVANSLIQGGIGEDELYFYPGEISKTLIEGNENNDFIRIGGEDSDTTLIGSTIAGGTGNDFIAVGLCGPVMTGDWIFPVPDPVPDNWRIFPSETSSVSLETIPCDRGYIQGSSLDGGAGDDLIYAGGIIKGDVTSSILGGDGNDSIYGLSKNGDTGAYFAGGSGSDDIGGTYYNDTISGGDANDVIVGGTGGDSLTGGSGNDLFIYLGSLGSGNQDSYVTGNATSPGNFLDTITDFNATAADRFGLSYAQARVLNLTAGFTIDWQTTINVALSTVSGGWLATDVGVLVITGQNAGTYMLYDDDSTATWQANKDGIVALTNPTGIITSANFLAITMPTMA